MDIILLISDYTWLDMTVIFAVGAVLLYCLISVVFKIAAKSFRKN